MLVFFFGVRRRATRLAAVMLLCPTCHTPAAHVIRRVRRWFSIFFIPLLPFGESYDMTCTMCGTTLSISPRQAGRYVGAAAATATATTTTTTTTTTTQPGSPSPRVQAAAIDAPPSALPPGTS